MRLIDSLERSPLAAQRPAEIKARHRDERLYELIVERHRKASTILTSNRDPAEWLTMMSDTLLVQSTIDRLTAGAHTLIIEGPSYRQGRTTAAADLDTRPEHQ